MNNNIEKEYKILVTKEQFNTLYKHFNQPLFYSQTNVYYDTCNYDIRNAKGAMRIRDINKDHIFTLKMHSSKGLLEYEKNLPSNSIECFEDEEISSLLNQYHIQGPFHEIGNLKTERAIYYTEYAELCFDINTYNGIVDYEIEYEYKKDHDGLTVFQNILSIVNIVYTSNCISKIQRALNSKIKE